MGSRITKYHSMLSKDTMMVAVFTTVSDHWTDEDPNPRHTCEVCFVLTLAYEPKVFGHADF